MGDGAVSTSTVKVVPTDWNRPVTDKTIATGNTVSQVQNPDVSVSTNPITPPNIIVAKATQETNQVVNVEAVKQKKPEFVLDISKYFKTIYLDLEEDIVMLFAQTSILTSNITKNNIRPIPTNKMMLGRPKTLEELVSQGRKLLDSPEFKEAFKCKEQNGVFAIGKTPEWLNKKIELLAKKHVFFYASHKDLEDYGMDMDYLTIPMIDKTAILPEALQKQFPGYSNLRQLKYLIEYDNLLTEYSGVSTVGKLGRELGISGVELYNLWKELDKTGIVTSLNWEHKEDGDKSTVKTAKKWLEVASNVNVKGLMASIDCDQNIKPKLEKYLLTLQQGKKRDDAFAKSYENLKVDYYEIVLKENYYLGGLQVLSALDVAFNNQNLNNYYRPKANEWIEDYDYFSSQVKVAISVLTTAKTEKAMSYFKDFTDKRLEGFKQEYEGENLPVGQEFLFQILEEMDSIPKEKISEALYAVKYK